MTNKIDISVLELALVEVTKSLDTLISNCLNESGLPVAPSRKAIAQARAALPPYCRNAFTFNKVVVRQ